MKIYISVSFGKIAQNCSFYNFISFVNLLILGSTHIIKLKNVIDKIIIIDGTKSNSFWNNKKKTFILFFVL